MKLTNKVLIDIEIKVLEMGPGFASIQRKKNESDLKQDFSDFSRLICTKWFLRNEPTPQFSEMPVFSSKSTRKPSKGHPNLKGFSKSIGK